jgi:hypothetical protein
MPLRNLFLRDEAQEAAERTTLAYHMDRLGGVTTKLRCRLT